MNHIKMKIAQKVVVGAVVIKEGKALILQRSEKEKTFPGLWELPSGKKEDLEKTEDALLREVEEETGLEIEIVGQVSVFDYSHKGGDEIRDFTQINFLARILGKPDVKLSKEHQGYAWVGEGDIDRYNLTKQTEEAIARAFDALATIDR